MKRSPKVKAGVIRSRTGVKWSGPHDSHVMSFVTHAPRRNAHYTPTRCSATPDRNGRVTVLSGNGWHADNTALREAKGKKT